MNNLPRYLLTAWHTDISSDLLLNWYIDVLTEQLSALLTLTLFTNWMNDLFWLYSLGGSHVCASLFLGLFTVNFLTNLKSTLNCLNCKGSGYYLLAPWTMESFFSHNRYVLKLKGWLEEESDNLGYWFGTREIISLL